MALKKTKKLKFNYSTPCYMLFGSSQPTASTLKQIRSQTETSFHEKGSKFMGYLFPIDDKTAFDAKLEILKNNYPDATHHCYAWRLNPTHLEEFAQDDGEPSGTAGLPILNQLKSFDVVNAALVVVRYYGGTNLGKSGLIQAYGAAAELCLQKVDLQPIKHIWKLKITYPYDAQNTIEKLKHRFNLNELNSSYTDRVSLILGCPVDSKKRLQNRLSQLAHRNIEAEFLEESYL